MATQRRSAGPIWSYLSGREAGDLEKGYEDQRTQGAAAHPGLLLVRAAS